MFSKIDEFSKNFRKGEGLFGVRIEKIISNLKILLQICLRLNEFLEKFSKKGRRGQRPFGNFPEIHPF